MKRLAMAAAALAVAFAPVFTAPPAHALTWDEEIHTITADPDVEVVSLWEAPYAIPADQQVGDYALSSMACKTVYSTVKYYDPASFHTIRWATIQWAVRFCYTSTRVYPPPGETVPKSWWSYIDFTNWVSDTWSWGGTQQVSGYWYAVNSNSGPQSGYFKTATGIIHRCFIKYGCGTDLHPWFRVWVTKGGGHAEQHGG